MEIDDILQTSLSFFKEDELKREIVSKAKIVEVPPGALILDEGSYVKTVPLLLSGLVKVVRLERGKEILLYYIYPLESCIVSIYSGMNELKSRAKAIAEDHSKAILIPSSMVGEWQRKYSSFNSFVLNLYQKRFENILDAFNAMAFQSLDERILSHLQAKAQALNSNEIKLTHQGLSDELGAARETVSRMLKKLETEDKLKLHRGYIEIILD
ncbi:MAG: Crp/Fnr family transcriptional regulator [Cyclobacteriaceae bacterium]